MDSPSPLIRQHSTPVKRQQLMSPTAAASTGSLPRNPRGKMPLFGRVAGYRQPPEPGAGAGAGQHRLSAVSGRSRLSGSGSGTAEIWVDSAPGGGGDKEAVVGDCSTSVFSRPLGVLWSDPISQISPSDLEY